MSLQSLEGCSTSEKFPYMEALPPLPQPKGSRMRTASLKVYWAICLNSCLIFKSSYEHMRQFKSICTCVKKLLTAEDIKVTAARFNEGGAV